MQDFEGKVAVVTGAASGVGKALAERFAQAGMKVVLADVEEQALDTTVAEFRGREFDVLGVLTDVSKAASVEEMARRTLDAYGGVHVLCNNAGVLAMDGDRRIWEHSLRDWEWMLGVNMWGVIHGIKTFLPIMLAQDVEGHVVNTASIAGLTSGAGLAIYGTTKHAVVRISEALHLQLAEMDAKVKTSVLCPSGVNTRIAQASRNRPDELWDEGARSSPEQIAQQRSGRTNLSQMGMPPEEVAEQVLQAIQDEQFYILTHPGSEDAVRTRMENIVQRRNPEPWPPAGDQ